MLITRNHAHNHTRDRRRMDSESAALVGSSSNVQITVTQYEFDHFCNHGDSDASLCCYEEGATEPDTRSTHSVSAIDATCENTYRTEPLVKFVPAKVEPVIQGALSEALTGVRYDPARCSGLARELSEVIKERVKRLELPRHKLVSFVCVGEKRGQGMRLASRCLWDRTSDNFASASFANRELFAVGVVFGVYLE